MLCIGTADCVVAYQVEVSVITGALDLTHKTARLAMTPLEKVFMLSAKAVLDQECIQSVLHRGHSRVPVYGSTRLDILGIILVKDILRVCINTEVCFHCWLGLYQRSLSCQQIMYRWRSFPLESVLQFQFRGF